jgi:ATP-binding cassette subfamily B protein
VTTAFVPIGERSRYNPPRAGISDQRDASWLRRTLPLVLSHKAMFFTAIVGAFAGLVVQVQIPTVIGRAIDNAIVAKTSPLGGYIAVIFLLGLARWVLSLTSRTLLLKTAYRIEFDLRNIVYEHLTRLSFSFFDHVQSGELMARSNSDVRAVQMYLATAPVILAQCAVAVVVIVEMLLINPVLAFVATVTMPFIGVLGIQVRQRLFPVSWLVQARLAEVATTVDENINGIRVVKSFAAEGQQLRQLYGAAERHQWAVVQDAEIRARWTPMIENLPRLGQAFLLLVGGWMAYQGTVSIGTLVAFNAYILLLQPPFRQLGLLVMLGQRAKASAQRIFAITDTVPAIQDKAGAIDLVTCRGQVDFDHVTFGYRADSPVLADFDLHLRPGETVALVGRSGSGKSTVGRLLARFYDVDDGAVSVDDHDVRGLTMTSLRHHVGLVLDEPFLFSVSIRDNIAFGRLDASFDEVVAAAKAAQADRFIRELPDGYDTVVGERGYTLSGGQRQRIAIARTLLVDPPVLVLDDATSAIDAQVEQLIHAALRRAMENRTTIIIGHRVSTISLADRVAVIEGGRIVAEGTHTALLTSTPIYRQILAAVVAETEAEEDAYDGDGEAPDGVGSADEELDDDQHDDFDRGLRW